MHLFIAQKTDLFNEAYKKMLHVAPEPQLASIFREASYIDYLSADLTDPAAMVQMDITNIPFPDGTFDFILCSHVLEHVAEDLRAMREFWRVLKVDGWALLQVPITSERTFDNPAITSPEERERVFGQHDHVRCYGPDYRDRLVGAGFSVVVDSFARDLDEITGKRYGIMRNEDLYVCRKAGERM